MAPSTPYWRQVTRAFHERAAEYDQWFEGTLLFPIELAALEDLPPLPAPKLEVGVGPGRFARALGVSLGVDAARAPLELARRRGISPAQALGEALPFRSGALGTIFLLFTLCFIEEPRILLRESARVLRREGRLVIGTIPAAGAWGRMLQAKQRQGHPFYRHARLLDPPVLVDWLAEAGFSLLESRSTLFQPPEGLERLEAPRKGIHPEAGFVVLLAGRR